MAKKISEILEEDMDGFISSYLSGSLDNFVTKDDTGNAHESDIFDLYCNLGKVFDIFCEKLEEQKNTG